MKTKNISYIVTENDFNTPAPAQGVTDWPVSDGETDTEVEVEVEAEIREEDASFSHEFGTEKQTDYSVASITVFLGDQDITDFLNKKVLSDMERAIEEKIDASDFEG